MKVDAKKRIVWLDMANVLAMVFVVWLHIPSALESPVVHMEYIVVNAQFFILAGCSFRLAQHKYECFASLIHHLVRRLLLPTVVFYAVTYLLWLLVGKQMAGDVAEWYEPLVQFLTGNFGLVLATYWFIVCLIGMQILFFCLHRILTNNMVLAMVCGLLPLLTLVFGDVYFYCIPEVFAYIPFFVIGNIMCGADGCLKEQAKTLLYLLAGWGIYFIVTYFADCPMTYTVTEALCGMIMCGVVVYVSKLFGKHDGQGRLMSILRYGALLLLATQNYIIGICKVLFDRLTMEQNYLASHMVLKPLVLVVVYLVTIPVILFVRRFCPQVLGRQKQG